MERMTFEAFARARSYLLEQARPLERELFRVQFEAASPGAALKALETYRNDDGGFGGGLEPDYRAMGSSVLATCVALGRLEELEISGNHPFVRGALDYLLKAYDAPAKRWPIVPATGEAEPHAPWWNIADLEETFAGFRINPMAEVLACLWRFGRADERRLSRSLSPVLLEHMKTASKLGPSEFECLLRLWRSPMDDAGMRAFLNAFLRERIPGAVERDPEKWTSYGLKPLWAVPDPQSPGNSELKALLDRALDFEISNQASNGAWEPFWDWEGAFPGYWPAAREEWRGWLTLRNLKTFQAFYRLPEGC
jgi:hypothetical protein